MKNWISRNSITILGVILGALGGFLYWKFIGCSTGTCRITSNPLNSTAYFAFMGGLVGNMLSPFLLKKRPDQSENR